MFSLATKVWLFLIALCLTLLIVGFEAAGRAGLLFGFIGAVALVALIFVFGESRLLAGFSARRWRGQDPWGLLSLIDRTSQKIGGPTPQLYLIESDAVTAFSLAFSLQKPLICVSTGLLQKLTPEEVEAVVVHQVCHVHRFESFSFGVVTILANSLMGLGLFFDQFWPVNLFVSRKQSPFLSLFSPIGWALTRSVVRKRTYFETDLEAASVLENRDRLGEVLWRLQGLAETRPLTVPPGTSHLFIVDPQGFTQKNFFLRAHPPLQDRLRELIGAPNV